MKRAQESMVVGPMLFVHSVSLGRIKSVKGFDSKKEVSAWALDAAKTPG